MNKEDIATTIIAMETAALEEWNKGNPTPFLEIMAKDITYFDPFTERRFDGIEKMTEFYESLRGKGSVDKQEMINPLVQATDNMAILTYNLESHSKGKIYRWNCTEVYRLEEDDKWKIAHNHWSFIKPFGEANG